MATFHEGELAVQKQAGTQRMASRVGTGIQPFIFDGADKFLRDQVMLVTSSIDEQKHVWASILTGEPGFLQPIDETRLYILALPLDSDPLAQNIKPGSLVGLLAIDLANRLRVRVNGIVAQQTADGFIVEARQVYGNCQKYIQSRQIAEIPARADHHAQHGLGLGSDQQEWIRSADTFFIASAHASGGADASHRGGNPGFVHVLSDRVLEFPDYAGNTMFNTLGNIAVNPATGLLFVDFKTGRTLQLTGQATILWQSERIAEYAGAQRIVQFEVAEGIETSSGLAFRFGHPRYSRFNPG